MTTLIPLKGKIQRLGKDTPTASGWFSAKLLTKTMGTVQVTGDVNGYDIHEGISIKCNAEEDYRPGWGIQYKIQPGSLKVITSTEQDTIRFFSSNIFKGIGRTTASKLYNTFKEDLFYVIKNEPERLKTEAGLTDDQVKSIMTGCLDDVAVLRCALPPLTQTPAKELIKKYRDGTLYIQGTILPKNILTAKELADFIMQNPYKFIGSVQGFSFRIADRIAVEISHIPKNNWERLTYVYEYTLQEALKGTLKLSNHANPGCANNSIALVEMKPSEETELRLLTEQNADYQFQNNDEFRKLIMEPTGRYLMASVPNLGICSMLNTGYDAENDAFAMVNVPNSVNFRPFVEPSLFDPDVLSTKIKECSKQAKQLMGEPLDPFQENAIRQALTNQASIITGGPGCGKSSVVKYICDIWSQTNKQAIALIAPTGRAAKNLTEKTGRPASTIASIEIQMGLIKNAYIRACQKGLPFDYRTGSTVLNYGGLAIIDEASMVGTESFGNIIYICHKVLHMQIVLVGDPEQLPPIDYGQPFKDLIKSAKLPIAVLPLCHRSELRLISDNGKAIMKGSYDTIQWSPEFAMQETDDEEIAAKALTMQYYTRLGIQSNAVKMPGPKTFQKVMLLAATKKGPAGVGSMNITIQDFLNPCTGDNASRARLINPADPKEGQYIDVPGTIIKNTVYDNGELASSKAYRKTTLRVGDRVVCTENNKDAEGFCYNTAKDPKHTKPIDVTGVNNGDCGNICRYVLPMAKTDGYILVHMDDDRYMKFPVPSDKRETLKLQLGYALTVHKAQGSEAETVLFSAQHRVASMPPEYAIANQNLLNTAVTRAKKSVSIIGSTEMVKKCVATPIKDRVTRFAELLDQV